MICLLVTSWLRRRRAGTPGRRLAVARVAVERARRRELAQLVADHVLGDEHRDELLPLCTANVRPTISGRIVERRDQVLMTFFASCRCASTHLVEQVLVDERTLLD